MFAQTNTLPANGNVGLNTTTPSALLDVNGNMVVDSSVVIKDSLNVQKKLIVDQDIKVKGEAVFVGEAKFKDKLVVDGLTKLNGDLKIKSLEDTNTTNNRLLLIQPNGKVKSSIELYPQPPTSICLTVLPWSIASSLSQNAPLNAVALCPSYGNLGVGTVIPNAKLNVYTGTETGLIVETGHQNDYGYGIQSKVSRNLTKAIVVYNTNTNSETFKVNGDGTVYATRVRVLTTPFPDYVFNEDYKLMSLSKLENYITINQHLPNMPTAKDVETDGADLGEINRVLVEKVEELTLYMIAMDKRMKVLEEENKALKE